ncbi:putative lipid A biosynthesis (KDO)2-(lauroyl)-lipid IVa acyltransferase [Trichinella spiralis]|uniref:putative lipid A biosynthesis (KDO)2-(lauroyl)-lipid IVa acyltransferase n=1 Tax=Trichinella spiralis TaxID=6334 RepID=UPI0001EFE537|nr:putative lipid A biosynthesis (KDO)2-(lauroyl)-lipid IVa acyltransferase [Trichinella spiralis]
MDRSVVKIHETIPVSTQTTLATYLSLHEDWDPVAAGIRWLYNKLNFCARLKNKLSGAKSRTELDEEQSESLIDNMPVISSFFTKSANLLRNGCKNCTAKGKLFEQ